MARRIERYQDHSKQSPEGGPGVSVAFFQMIYQVLIGQERGPRFGSFVALYGIAETRALIERALAGELAARSNLDSRRQNASFDAVDVWLIRKAPAAGRRCPCASARAFSSASA